MSKRGRREGGFGGMTLALLAASCSHAVGTGADPVAEWPTAGRTYSEQHFSPLHDIDAGNARELGLAWSLDLAGVNSLEATPLFVNGVLYFTASDSIVFAVDAKSGRQLWRFDPQVWKFAGKRYRNLFPAHRGVAYWKGRIYLGSFDGRLIALDARSGREIWEVPTLDEFPTGYITGAPRAFNGKIVIGNGGAESGRARGFVSAYDAQTGRRLWRFHTVPGNPADGFENAAMADAAKTWTGEWWKFGGGGTVWNAITYDPETNLVYIGTGNGTPWNRKVRSPGGGDNLFLCSIVALDADTGEYRWHYQTTPGESWDYNSSMDIVLADLTIDAKPRKVILHAPKNGFFYVIDRQTGRLISAEKIAKVTWAERIDPVTGRPVESADARAPQGRALVWPSSVGAHNWQPMSFNPITGLTYIPVMEMPILFADEKINHATWQLSPNFFRNTGWDTLQFDADAKYIQAVRAGISGSLLAWDPVHQRKVWQVPMPGIWNGGTLTTGGNLVFQGNAAGDFVAYNATTGKPLWSINAGLGIVAAPITYRLNSRQYVSVLVGWGGTLPSGFGIGVGQHGWVYGRQPRRLLTFTLNGAAKLPPSPLPAPVQPVDDLAIDIVADDANAGRDFFNTSCALCHGWEAVAGGAAPDLRASGVALRLDGFTHVLRDGALLQRGMPQYDDLSETEIRNLYMYIRRRARSDLTQTK